MRLARFARVRLLRHALPISLLILRKKPTVLQSIAYVAGVKRGRGNLGAREHVGCASGKGKERLQGRHCFLHFLRSDSERENSDWSELIKCQSST